jgi:hypothetical protein
MSANETVSGFSASTLKHSGTDLPYNYSVDQMKKAAFVDELNYAKIYFENSVAKDFIIEYLNIRIDEINKRYK